MIKISFIGEKQSGKSISCFFLSKFFSKNNKTLLLSLDKFNNYVDYYKTKKLPIKNNIIEITNNFHILDFPIDKFNENEIIKKIDNLFNKSFYEAILIDLPISFSKINLNILSKSNICIIPFKIENDIKNFHNNLINLMIENKINVNVKYLCFLSKNNLENVSKIIQIRKYLLGLVFEKTIPYYDFDNYYDLLDNRTLENDYEQIFENIANKYFNIE